MYCAKDVSMCHGSRWMREEIIARAGERQCPLPYFEDVTFLMFYNTRCNTFVKVLLLFEWLFGVFVTVSEIKRECDVVTALAVKVS